VQSLTDDAIAGLMTTIIALPPVSEISIVTKSRGYYLSVKFIHHLGLNSFSVPVQVQSNFFIGLEGSCE